MSLCPSQTPESAGFYIQFIYCQCRNPSNNCIIETINIIQQNPLLTWFLYNTIHACPSFQLLSGYFRLCLTDGKEKKMKVAVIGGGPAGLATLKFLATAHLYFPIPPLEVRLFEAEGEIGGTFVRRVYEDAEVCPPLPLSVPLSAIGMVQVV